MYIHTYTHISIDKVNKNKKKGKRGVRKPDNVESGTQASIVAATFS